MLAVYRLWTRKANEYKSGVGVGGYLKWIKFMLQIWVLSRQRLVTNRCFCQLDTFNGKTTNPKLFIVFCSAHLEGKTPKCWLTQSIRELVFNMLQAANVQINFQKHWYLKYCMFFHTCKVYIAQAAVHLAIFAICNNIPPVHLHCHQHIHKKPQNKNNSRCRSIYFWLRWVTNATFGRWNSSVKLIIM